jgi:hypothetical protein
VAIYKRFHELNPPSRAGELRLELAGAAIKPIAFSALVGRSPRGEQALQEIFWIRPDKPSRDSSFLALTLLGNLSSSASKPRPKVMSGSPQTAVAT